MNNGIKFILACRRCGCTMEFSTRKHTELPSTVICQNCGQELSAGRQTLLSTALAASSSLMFENEITQGEGFYISCEALPSGFDADPEMFD